MDTNKLNTVIEDKEKEISFIYNEAKDKGQQFTLQFAEGYAQALRELKEYIKNHAV